MRGSAPRTIDADAQRLDVAVVAAALAEHQADRRSEQREAILGGNVAELFRVDRAALVPHPPVTA